MTVAATQLPNFIKITQVFTKRTATKRSYEAQLLSPPMNARMWFDSLYWNAFF